MQKQNTPQANESISQKLIQAGTAVYDWPSTVFRNVYNKFSNLARTNHDLGFRLLERGELRDAIFRFKVALWFDDNYAMAWYNLGCCQMSLGRNKDATAAFRRVLKLVPGDENAQFMLAMVAGDTMPASQLPKNMPLSLVVSQFNGLAEVYDQLQIEELRYVGHTNLVKALRKKLENNKNDYAILDVGCGTGLCGALLRPIAGKLHGVDIAQNMVKVAARMRNVDGKAIYDSLYAKEAHQYMSELEEPGSYDIVIAGNVFNYIGDITAMFTWVARSLNQSGIFVFNTEIIPDPGYGFIPRLGRFGHSETYIRALVEKSGFKLLELEHAPMYPDYTALQCVLQKA